MPRNHVMIDIETLGSKPGSVILSIGAVVFDPFEDMKRFDNTFYRNISLESSLDYGLKVSADTKVLNKHLKI